jgi:hypothetical protein
VSHAVEASTHSGGYGVYLDGVVCWFVVRDYFRMADYSCAKIWWD